MLAVGVMLTVGCGGGEEGRTSSGGGQSTGVASLGHDTEDETASADGPKLDASMPPNDLGPGGDCPGGGGGMSGEVDFSIIWIANSPEGTVSKIDTITGTELARYYTGPTNGNDDPSRTSVNLAGDVAVTNRSGGIAKFAAREDDCIDVNGNGTID
ncbi:MAG: hypothetical protein KDK70_29160, partial [Myxococcales bacterium]|nr:hypothetical protein [Myxococcales bacterium]